MITVNVEVILKSRASTADSKITSMCIYYLRANKFRPGTVISNFNPTENLYLYENVEHIIIGEHADISNVFIDFSAVKIKWFLYTLDKNGLAVETEYDADGESVSLATVRVLPSLEFFNLWENLVYDTTIKENLIKYASTAMLFADRGVDCNIINCNRVVLLHGPPGTGKTSLCKALAHKLTVHLNNRFKRGFLLEINSHSLFSKWFSESGKLVTKMFSKITEFLKDPDAIIFVLIDEIESLSHARNKCLSGVEPSDSIRVVNALLTQIDQIKNHPNVLILTTSNMTDAIDLAFVDRADIKQYIGLPGPEAIYQIFYSCIQELLKAKIVQTTDVLLPLYRFINSECTQDNAAFRNSKELFKISELSSGLSGRTLRKIPFLAHSLFLENNVVNITITEFLEAMKKAVERVKEDKEYFSNN